MHCWLSPWQNGKKDEDPRCFVIQRCGLFLTPSPIFSERETSLTFLGNKVLTRTPYTVVSLLIALLISFWTVERDHWEEYPKNENDRIHSFQIFGRPSPRRWSVKIQQKIRRSLMPLRINIRSAISQENWVHFDRRSRPEFIVTFEKDGLFDRGDQKVDTWPGDRRWLFGPARDWHSLEPNIQYFSETKIPSIVAYCNQWSVSW
jgi:hypothetical protein